MGEREEGKDREARTGRDMTVTHGRHWAGVGPSLAGGRPGAGGAAVCASDALREKTRDACAIGASWQAPSLPCF